MALIIAGAALGIVCAGNVLVDPLGVFGGVSLPVFQSQRWGNFSRPARAEAARHGTWNTVILGTSRPKAGLAANHATFQGQKALNLAVDGARMAEVAAIFEYVSARQPIQRVLLFLDFAMFRSGRLYTFDFPESRFSADLSLFDYYCRHLFGGDEASRSWRMATKALRGYAPPPGQSNGFYAHTLRGVTEQRDLFERVIRTHVRMCASIRTDERNLEAFRRVVRECERKKIELILSINPVHALDLELWRAVGNWGNIERWKRDLVSIIAQEGATNAPLWDFSGYSSRTTESVPVKGDARSRMQFYYENSHYTPVLGSIMLDQATGIAANDFGVRLTRENIDQEIAKTRLDRETYARIHAGEVAWVQRLVTETLAMSNAAGEDDAE